MQLCKTMNNLAKIKKAQKQMKWMRRRIEHPMQLKMKVMKVELLMLKQKIQKLRVVIILRLKVKKKVLLIKNLSRHRKIIRTTQILKMTRF